MNFLGLYTTKIERIVPERIAISQRHSLGRLDPVWWCRYPVAYANLCLYGYHGKRSRTRALQPWQNQTQDSFLFLRSYLPFSNVCISCPCFQGWSRPRLLVELERCSSGAHMWKIASGFLFVFRNGKDALVPNTTYCNKYLNQMFYMR